jgi:hypothetical protein
MPTKGYSIRKDNFVYLESTAAEQRVTPSEYLNMLLENDRQDLMDRGEDDIEQGKINRGVVLENIKSGIKGDGLHTCKKCGYMLPYFRGKCKNGCK